MSKVVMSLPKGMAKNSAIGGLIALIAYVALQFLRNAETAAKGARFTPVLSKGSPPSTAGAGVASSSMVTV